MGRKGLELVGEERVGEQVDIHVHLLATQEPLSYQETVEMLLDRELPSGSMLTAEEHIYVLAELAATAVRKLGDIKRQALATSE